MYQIIGKRWSGKTINLITLAKENDAILVVRDVNSIIQKMYDLGITGIEVLSFAEFEAARYNFKTNKRYIIDEIDDYVKFTAGKDLIGFSLSLKENN